MVLRQRFWRVAIILIGCVASAMIVATYPVFSQNWDEPATLATGIEWLTTGSYTYEAQHPPLARIAAAVLPYLRGARSYGMPLMYDEGRALLGEGAHYRRTLFLARLGMLPFFWLLLAVCAMWGARTAGPPGAVLATLFAACNPNLLAHAGIAGTDLAPAAFVVTSVYCWMRWRETPSIGRALMFGAAIGLATATKFSAVAFLGIAIVIGEAWRAFVVLSATRSQRSGESTSVGIPWRSAIVALIATVLVVWAVYRFHVGPVSPGGVSVPAPELIRGISRFLAHSSGGHPAFLLGEVRFTGWWYYYLVVLVVKTPPPLLALAIAGAVLGIRARRIEGWTAAVPVAGAIGVLVPSILSHVDLGVRIVLAIYPFLAVLAARGAVYAWRDAMAPSQMLVRRIATALLVAATIVIPIRAWPDYLAYFNPIAGAHPERVLVDSNLDWGQDLYRLADTVRARKIDSLHAHYFGSASFSAVGLTNVRRLSRDERATGWIAASETFLAGVWSDTSLQWLARRTPVAHIGRSMRLYYIAPSDTDGARQQTR
ncbi:MAG: phospholipid carrier-dependent glycosyltransferase [bacterium]